MLSQHQVEGLENDPKVEGVAYFAPYAYLAMARERNILEIILDFEKL